MAKRKRQAPADVFASNGDACAPVSDGEWIRPARKFLMQCCDCGLVHDMDFRVLKGRAEFRAYRNMRLTKRARTAKKGHA